MTTRLLKTLGIAMALLLISTLAFAAGATEGAGGAVTVKQWAFPFTDEATDQGMFDQIEAEMQKTNPNISVEIEFFPWDGRRERMLTAIAARVAPDVAYLNDDMKPLYEGSLLNLFDYLTDEDLADFKPGAIEGSTYKGELAYLPVLINSVAKFANLDLLEEAGIDPSWIDEIRTWEEFFAVCDQVKAAGIWPYTIGPQQASVIDEFSQWVYQAGGEFYNEDMTECTMDSPEAIRAIEAYALMWEKYINPADMDKTSREATEATFIPGRAAFRMGQNQAIRDMREMNPDLRVGLAYAMKDERSASSGTIAGYGVFEQTKVPEAAVEWAKAITGETGMYLIDKTVNLIPPRYSVDKRLTAEMNDPIFARAVENSQWFFPTVPASPVGAAANEEITSVLMQVVMKELTPAQAGAEMKRKVDALLDDYYAKRK